MAVAVDVLGSHHHAVASGGGEPGEGDAGGMPRHHHRGARPTFVELGAFGLAMSVPANWSTHGGAELDLGLEIDGKILGLEIKCTAQPTTSPTSSPSPASASSSPREKNPARNRAGSRQVLPEHDSARTKPAQRRNRPWAGGTTWCDLVPSPVESDIGTI